MYRGFEEIYKNICTWNLSISSISSFKNVSYEQHAKIALNSSLQQCFKHS